MKHWYYSLRGNDLPMVIKLISRAETEFQQSLPSFHCCTQPYFWVMGHSFSGCWTHLPFVTEAEEQPARGQLMHPVGEPGSIDVSASLASTLAGFLFGALLSSWIFICSDFWTFDTGFSTPCSMHLPIVSMFIFIISSYSTQGYC